MKTKHEKFNYEARVIWECPCCGHRWSDDKLDYCPNCEVRMTYPAEQLEPEGEVYVKADPSEDHSRREIDFNVDNHVRAGYLKKVSSPQPPSEEGLKRFFLYLVDAGITDAIFDEESFDAYIYDNYKEAITELLNQKR